jgi:hypothetical protein
MTSRAAVSLARWLLMLAFVGGVVIGWALGATPGRQQLFLVSVTAYAAVGWLVTHRRPDNPIGWLFLLVASLSGMAAFADAAVRHALAVGDPGIWYGRWGAWYTAWFWFPLFASATLFTLLLFPDGPASRRWRPVVWVSAVASVLLTAGVSLQTVIPVGRTAEPVNGACPPGLTLEPEYKNCGHWVANPLGAPRAVGQGTWGETAAYVLVAVLVGCFVLAVISVVLRFRASRGAARLQMRWFAFGAVVLLVWLTFSGLFVKGDPIWGEVGFALATATLPVACGLAILRYRLYDVDRIISRTASYAIVTGVLLATYAVIVTSVTRLLPDSSTLGVATATLAAAALARPLYRRVQHAVDRRFNRARYDAERTVDAFGSHLRREIRPEAVTAELVTAVRNTMQPKGVTVWVRPS